MARPQTWWSETERRVLVGHEDHRVADYTVVPADHAGDEVEDPSRVAAGEKNREPRGDHREDRADVEEEEHDVMRGRVFAMLGALRLVSTPLDTNS